MQKTIEAPDAMRLALIEMTLKTLRESADARATGAIAEYEKQRAEVMQRLAAAPGSALSGRPSAQVVGMKTACLQGKASS